MAPLNEQEPLKSGSCSLFIPCLGRPSMNGRQTSVCRHINMFRLPGKRIRKRHSRSVRPLLSVFLGRFSNGFSGGGKYVPCILKYVRHISNYVRHIFCLLRRGANALKTSFHFPRPKCPFLCYGLACSAARYCKGRKECRKYIQKRGYLLCNYLICVFLPPFLGFKMNY